MKLLYSDFGFLFLHTVRVEGFRIAAAPPPIPLQMQTVAYEQLKSKLTGNPEQNIECINQADE